MRIGGGCAAKAVGLTSGGLRCVLATRLRSSRGDLTAAQKSAEGILGGSAPLKARTAEVASRAAISRASCGRTIRSAELEHRSEG